MVLAIIRRGRLLWLWFEAAKMETPSGLFDREANAAAEIGIGKRRDALSVYLDATELEF